MAASFETLKKLSEVEDQYYERFGSYIYLGFSVTSWSDDDFIAAYEECLADDKPFDFNDPKWPWNPPDELPPDAVI